MQFSDLMAALSKHPIRLQQDDDNLVILGDDEGLDSALLDSLVVHKSELLDLVQRNGGDWLSPAFRITPDMLPLASLTQEEIDRIIDSVPGGAGNVQDIYPLAPLQEGILYHHLAAEQGDPYVLQALFGADRRPRLDDFTQALQGVIDRHDILRTSVVWEGLDEPMQVVWQEATLALEEVVLDSVDGDIEWQLQQRFDTQHHRLDVRQAPLMRLVCAQDRDNDRWVAILLFHHMALDHAALEVVQHEMQAFLLGQADALPEAVPYRNYVAQVRLGVSGDAHEAFFREMLADVDEPTLPLGFAEVPKREPTIEEVQLPVEASLSRRLRAQARQLGVSAASLHHLAWARLPVEASLSRRLRAQARQLGVSAASLHHLAWARVVGGVSGKQDVVFGTVLMGRMQGGDGADRALGMFINTLPLRVKLSGQGVREGVKNTHAGLTALLGHEHASLALAQRCSGVPAPTPLFGSLLNYRHSGTAQVATAQALEAWEGLHTLGGAEGTNYPLTLSVDDLGEGFSLSVLALSEIGAQRIGDYMLTALESLVQALEQTPEMLLPQLDILSSADRRQLLLDFNATTRRYPQDKTVHALFEAQVQASPDAPAAVHNGHGLTYAELNS
ncbi:condensation domain-containing protein, partial [Pseudomonas sp. JL3]|uniref:condensation domain-containing protein n=1 Tax=Pseudomonas sp. JL3 TaxID=2919943 RepID=UPI002859ACBA